MTQEPSLVPFERIAAAIYLFRGEKVMLDRDLARLYGVPTKALKQAVRRNAARFPPDFMFELSPEELAEWRSQFVTSKKDRMGLRHPPMAFSEHRIPVYRSIAWRWGRRQDCAGGQDTLSCSKEDYTREASVSHNASNRLRHSGRWKCRSEACEEV